MLALALLGVAVAIGDANRLLAALFAVGWLAGSVALLFRLHQLQGARGARLVLWMWLSFSFCVGTVPFYPVAG